MRLRAGGEGAFWHLIKYDYYKNMNRNRRSRRSESFGKKMCQSRLFLNYWKKVLSIFILKEMSK